MDKDKQYKAAADALRIISILAVVFIHTTTKTLEASGDALQEIPFTLFFNQISRFAVPLFFMISGFVLELNYHLHENYLSYLKKRINRIFIPYLFWSFIYYFFVYYQYRNQNFISAILRGDASYQLYFIPALLIFYFIFPVLHKFINIIGNIWIMALLFIIQISLLYYDYNVKPLTIFYPLAITSLNYFLFLLGVVTAKHHDRLLSIINKWKGIFILGTAVFTGIVFEEGYSGYLATHNYYLFYSQWRPSVLVYTIFLGGILYWFFDRKISFSPIVKKISNLSFFVFFIHVIIIEILWQTIGIKYFQIRFAQNLWWDPVFFISVVFISFLIAYLVHKIPKLSKLTG